MKKYKYLLFDADNTLFDFAACERAALFATFKNAGIILDDEKIACYSRINDSFWKALERGEVTKEALRYKRFESFCAEYGFKLDAREIASEYLRLLGLQIEMMDGAVETLEYYSPKYELYLITNGIKSVQTSRLAKSGLYKYFLNVFISEELGAEKPSKAYFDAVAAAIHDFNKDEALIIGDSLTSDIRGGINYGIDTCWMNINGAEVPEDMDITYTVKSLFELKNII